MVFALLLLNLDPCIPFLSLERYLAFALFVIKSLSFSDIDTRVVVLVDHSSTIPLPFPPFIGTVAVLVDLIVPPKPHFFLM